MNHVAIDLGGRESQLCARSATGEILKQDRVATKALPTLLKGMERSRVILETCTEAFGIADAALAAGHEVRVVPAALVKQLGVGSRGVKNDRKDAQVLSEVSCRIDLPSVHVPTQTSRDLKAFCGCREALLETRTMLINNVRGWLRGQLARVRGGATNTFPARVREHAAAINMTLPEHIQRQLIVIDTVNSQIKAADAELVKLAGEHPICRKLMTIPGVGPVTAIRFIAAVDRVDRFQNAHRVQSYLGLTPGENSSSDRRHRTGITKAGPAEVRRTLIQAAWSAFRCYPEAPVVVWARNIAERRGQFVAVVALARKLAGIMFALWRDGETYQPSKGAIAM